MAIAAPQETDNFILKLSDTTTSGTLYKPLSRPLYNAETRVTTPYDLPYHGHIAIIKINATIASLPVTILPVDNLADTTPNREAKAARLASSPKVGIVFYLKETATGKTGRIATLEIYNTLPDFDALVSTWFGDLTSYGVGSGYEVWCQLADYGFGLLQPGDTLDLTGFVIENCNFLQDDTNIIYVAR